MRLPLLILAAGLLPLVWGWGVYRAMVWLWPSAAAQKKKKKESVKPVPPHVIDYQI